MKLYNKGDTFDLSREKKKENSLRPNGRYQYNRSDETKFPFVILSRKKNPKGYYYTILSYNDHRWYKELHITHKELKRLRDKGECEQVEFSELEKMLAHKILLEK